MQDQSVLSQIPGYGSMRPFQGRPAMATISFKGRPFQHDMILQSVRWYLAYSLSGIVNLTWVWQTGQHEKANTQLSPSSLSP